jgi:hypothetical protein
MMPNRRTDESMDETTLLIPPLVRAATASLLDRDGERIVEVVWTTGATVQRRRRAGWDEAEEYDEELVVAPGSVRLERMQAGVPFLDGHRGWSVASVLGSVEPGSVRIEGGRGIARVRLTDAPDAQPAIQRVLEKHVAISVGYRVHRYEIIRREGQRELWRAVDWEPLEISAVPIPADAGAHIRVGESRDDALNNCLVIRAEAPASIQKRSTSMSDDIVASTSEVETRAVPVTASPPAAEIDVARAEANRTAAEILRICERHGLPHGFASELIERGATLDQARAAVLDRLAQDDMVGARRAEPAPAAPRSTGASDAAYRDAMSEALLHRHAPGAFALTDRGREFRGLTLIELARHTLERRGISTRGMSKMEVATEALLGRAGLHSTSDFPFILANVANKTLRQAYESTPRTFTAWARQRTIVDFKPVSVTQLGGAPSLLAVPESGEFTYGTIGEGREVYALLTYGRIVGITRQVLVNDDLDAFTRVPAAYGAAAADLESDIVYSILTGNPLMADGQPLFHSSHGNLGTAAAITEASLAEAYRLFGNQRGLDGRQISVLPRFIITPPGARSVEARKNVTATTPDSVGGVNPFANRLEPIEEARLIAASGPDPWFLAADPARIDTVEYAYLEGQQGVYTEVRQGFEVDGIEIKARHDFAAKAIDWRGLFRNAGV